ncbi:hypothetical protein [Spongiactinospora sp. TRM90649]|uniref:hypothetical protein n=1 Tax=Spongiactinospora sp. TRM90649 TaxID=3031114 RepID=UPI0023F71BB8|nr:hypothetical protein [Spongiactinospora sp. TRM90649]MDF5757805.1 hypothetical protein [Spongiactinospora sp. TRM90649]
MGVLIRAALAAALVVPAPILAPAAALAGSVRDDKERLAFRIKDTRITESSGLATSPTHRGIVYTHNDSDAGPTFYAIGPGGRTRATFRLSGAEARDWEGMAATTDPETGRGVLWFADIGDNMDGAWPDISVYKVQEPAELRDATLPATRYRFRYKDGARNAEGLMVNPRTGRLYIVSKEFGGSVYVAPRRLSTTKTNVLRRFAAAPLMATDAAFAPDGSGYVIRTYFSASLYDPTGKSIGRLTMPAVNQAESITYTRDGTAVLTGSEGVSSPVYRVPLPAGLRPRPTLTPTPERATHRTSPSTAPASAESPADGGVSYGLIALWAALVAVAVGVILFLVRLVR